MNELYTLEFYYDVIFGQSYRLVPRPSTLVPTGFLKARECLVAATNARLQNNSK